MVRLMMMFSLLAVAVDAKHSCLSVSVTNTASSVLLDSGLLCSTSHSRSASHVACTLHAVAQQQFCVAQHFVTGVHLQSASFVNKNEAAQVL